MALVAGYDVIRLAVVLVMVTNVNRENVPPTPGVGSSSGVCHGLDIGDSTSKCTRGALTLSDFDEILRAYLTNGAAHI